MYHIVALGSDFKAAVASSWRSAMPPKSKAKPKAKAKTEGSGKE